MGIDKFTGVSQLVLKIFIFGGLRITIAKVTNDLLFAGNEE